MKKIFCVHLYNDYSGSPLILSTVIKGLLKKGHKCEILTCAGQEGFLSGFDVPYRHFSYTWVANRWLRLLMFLWSQVSLFMLVIRHRKTAGVIYINTLLPFGAALAGWVLRKPVVYHMHEVSVKPQLLKSFLRWVANLTASQAIFVSHYLAKAERLPAVPSKIIPNALSDNFKQTAQKHPRTKENPTFKVLMLCSLKAYKGVNEFIAIAGKMPRISFDLVLNATSEEVDAFCQPEEVPVNLNLYPRQSNVHPFYQKADLVLNLSHPEQWIETFGMTLLEAMHYGIPCIAPPIGGPAEIIDHLVEGFLIDQRHEPALITAIRQLSTDQNLYNEMSQKAFQKAQSFSVQQVNTQVDQLMRKKLGLDAIHEKEMTL